jgi:hypothetical protein
MFNKILNAIVNHYISTIPEISKSTGVNEEIVEIAIDYWEKRGKINFKNANDVYMKNDCSTCSLKNYCNICMKKPGIKGEKDDFGTYREH